MEKTQSLFHKTLKGDYEDCENVSSKGSTKHCCKPGGKTVEKQELHIDFKVAKAAFEKVGA